MRKRTQSVCSCHTRVLVVHKAARSNEGESEETQAGLGAPVLRGKFPCKGKDLILLFSTSLSVLALGLPTGGGLMTCDQKEGNGLGMALSILTQAPGASSTVSGIFI